MLLKSGVMDCMLNHEAMYLVDGGEKGEMLAIPRVISLKRFHF